MKYYCVILLVISNLFSCASISKSKYACEASANSENLIQGKIGTYFMGNILQIGDCALSERLRVETGTFVKNRIAPIKKQITDNKADSRDDMLALYKLFGCDAEHENELVRFSRDNYSTLFESSENMSGRQSMLLIRNKLKEDPVLKEMCFK